MKSSKQACVNRGSWQQWGKSKDNNNTAEIRLVLLSLCYPLCLWRQWLCNFWLPMGSHLPSCVQEALHPKCSQYSWLGSAGWMDTVKATDVNCLLLIQILPLCIFSLLASHVLFSPSRCAGSVQGEASLGVLPLSASPVTRPRLRGGKCGGGQKRPVLICCTQFLLQWWKTSSCLYWGSGVLGLVFRRT